jgi:hypothetical protein
MSALPPTSDIQTTIPLYYNSIPPTTARVVDTAVEILGDPDAKVEQVDGGLLLKPSRPPIRRSVHAVTKG